ncbi:hyaluronan mediated motility receptor-like [Ceratina calcarata]|uniref:Hyaluronan mediated motility receptor-like n=1 Tax=Ceratina calcarata TaxID=156304 RepID=A0AAJ7RXW3_9HYME|nr:hyaluronan mediated motility receptor-like [Ceratina calcarata]
MSFSKAKIQRFNELASDVPPPGAYDPKLDNKVKGIVIEKSERFHDNRSVGSADCNLSTLCSRSHSSHNAVPTFRTPQLPRKANREQSRSTTKVKRSLISPNKQKLKYKSEHEYADLQIECFNKDNTIQELEKHIEDMKDEVQRLEEQHQKDMETMAKLQQEVLNEHDEKHQVEVERLRGQLLEASEEREREIEARKTMEGDLRNRLTDCLKRVTTLEDELANKKSTYVEKIASLEARIEELTIDLEIKTGGLKNEIGLLEEEKLKLNSCVNELSDERDKLLEKLETRQTIILELQAQLSTLQCELDELRAKYENLTEVLTCSHQAEINRLKDHYEEKLTLLKDKEITELKEAMAKKLEEETIRIKKHADKMVENAEAVTRETLAACRNECEERVKRVIAESDAKVNAMIKDAKATVEDEMRLTAERYKACLARVELERAALDEKLAQKDAEITRLSMTLEELRSSAETQESFGQSLQMELDRAETELAEKKEELRALKDQIRAEAAEMVARKKRFEVIMAENQASVAALSTRLAQSTAEVERLQYELQRGESSINEHRDLLNIMRSNSQMVHEQVHAIMEQLDVKKGLVDQLEAESLNEVQSMKSLFEAKIDDLRRVADKEIAKLKADCDAKTAQNAEITNQLHEMAKHVNNTHSMMLILEERNDAQVNQISQLELVNSELQERLNEQEATMEEVESLKDKCRKHEIALKEATCKLKELSDTVTYLENEQVIQNSGLLENEKSRREAAESEIKRLTESNERLMKEYEEISEKYAEIIGHQNLRQKIKHVTQLKDKINQLEQDLEAKMKIITQQQRIIEKYKTEEKRLQVKGKENLQGIPKTSTTPHKSLTPLRNRND